ncbi:MAG: efflux RND transporter periplasmic adaptor subunit [Thermoanaerobaculia bacterium]
MTRIDLATQGLALALAFCAGCSRSAEAPPPFEHGEERAAREVSQEGHTEGIVQLTPEAATRAGIRTAAVERRALATRLDTTGSVGFDETRQAHVSPRVPGRVESVAARLGESVDAGQLLARIDSIELGQAKAEFLQAKARAELAEETFRREEGLFTERVSSEQEMLTARAEFREAQAALQAAEETLHLYGLSQLEVEGLHYEDPRASIYEVRAPFAGRLVEQHASLGELVSPEEAMFLLADLSRLWIWIDVYERDLSRVHLDDTVALRVDAFPEEVFRGAITYLADQVDPGSRTVRARIEVANPEGRLRPGMFARVEVTDPHAAPGEAEAALVVPEAAVLRDGDTAVVFLPVGENRFERREVALGRRGAGWVEVLDGIAAGDEVVVEGGFVLKSEAAKEELGGGHGH